MKIVYAVAVVLGLTLVARAAEFHVSPNGDDAGPGTVERPFRTLIRARDAARDVNRNADVEVILHGGTWRLDRPVEFGPEDGGGGGHRVIYRAAEGERPVVSGGVPVTGWKLHDRKRNIWKAAAGRRRFRHVYVDDRPAIRARSPNRESDAHFGPYLSLTAPAKPECRISTTDWKLCAGAARLSEVELVILSHWYQQRIRIGSHRVDGDVVSITPMRPEGKFTKKPYFYGNSRFHFENALAFVDAPNEWYHDVEEGSLYLALPPGETPDGVRVEVPVAEALVVIRGTSEKPVTDLEIRGITFQCTGWASPSRLGLNITQFAQPLGVTRSIDDPDYPPGVLRAAHACRIAIRDCVVENAGATGIQFFADVDDSDLCGNRISNVAANGIEIDAHAEKNPGPDAQSTGVAIWNNVITRVGRSYTNGGGILAHNVRGLIVEHNLIHDMPYSGMQVGNQPGKMIDVGCGENRIRFNHVHHCVQLHDDGGGIYTLGGIQAGTVIAANFVHDVSLGEWADTYPVDHIYLDNFSSRIFVSGNVVRGGRAVERNRSAGNVLFGNTRSDPAVEANAGPRVGYDPRDPTPEPPPGEDAPRAAPALLSGTGDDAERGTPPPESRPEVAALLEHYLTPPAEFAWMARLRIVGPKFAIYDLTFPSPVTTEVPENDTVHGEWYRAHGTGKRPAVVVLHILDGRFYAARLVCTSLATAGLDALLVKLPFYGPRRPEGVSRPADDLELFELLVRQGVADTRRAAALLAGLPTTEPGRVDLCGISLGGFVGALAAGVDGNFGRATFALAGGGLHDVIGTGARETRKLKARFAEAGLTGEKLRAWLAPIDPLTFAHRLKSCDVLMFNVTVDEVVPESSARALAKAAGDPPIVWYEAEKHTGLLKHLPDVMRRNRAHFTKP